MSPPSPHGTSRSPRETQEFVFLLCLRFCYGFFAFLSGEAASHLPVGSSSTNLPGNEFSKFNQSMPPSHQSLRREYERTGSQRRTAKPHAAPQFSGHLRGIMGPRAQDVQLGWAAAESFADARAPQVTPRACQGVCPCRRAQDRLTTWQLGDSALPGPGVRAAQSTRQSAVQSREVMVTARTWFPCFLLFICTSL